MLSHYQPIAGDPDRFRGHDLIGEFLLENSVLMDARLMGEGIIPYDRFIDRNGNTGDLRNQPGRGIDLFAHDVGIHAE